METHEKSVLDFGLFHTFSFPKIFHTQYQLLVISDNNSLNLNLNL